MVGYYVPFVAKLDDIGTIQWNTFSGSTYSSLSSTSDEDGKSITDGKCVCNFSINGDLG
jgi:hypothetical protein